MSTPSQLYFGKGFFLCFATQILHPSGHSVAKKAGTAWEHWTSQIDDHLKPPTVAKRCTFRESRKSPALRGFVAGRWALATTSLYPSTKIERLQRAPNGTPWRRPSIEIECSGFPGLPRHDCPRQLPPHTRPNTVQIPPVGDPSIPCAETGTQGRHGRTRGRSVGVCLPFWRGCGLRPQMRRAAACDKLGALLACPPGDA